MSTTQDIANDFVALCARGEFDEAGRKYWAPDVVSLEPMEGPMARMQGIDALVGKGEWWAANHDIHGTTAEGPYVYGDQFAVRFTMDVTQKESGQRMKMDEVALYTLKDGKIVEEKFLFGSAT